MIRFILQILASFLLVVGCSESIDKDYTVMGRKIDDEGLRNDLSTKTGWSQSGTITTNGTVNSGPVSMQANFENEPGAYTVQLGFTAVDDASVYITRPIATIVWSVEGNEITRMVDVSNGMSITGVGQAVRVIINDYTRRIGPGAPPPAISYIVSITVVKGTRSYNGVPPTLAPLPTEHFLAYPSAAIDSYQEFGVPPNSGANGFMLMLMATNATNPDPAPGATRPVALLDNEVIAVQTGILYAAGGSATDYTILSEFDPRDFTWIPLISGCKSIRVYNKSATAGTKLWANILWSIDG